MKTKTIITELTQEDLVNLLCTATYRSNWLEIHRTTDKGVKWDGDECLEDTWAKCLLAGNPIECTDHYAEGDHYGELPYKVNDDEDGIEEVTYTLTLQDIINGLQKCADGTFSHTNYDEADNGDTEKSWIAKCFQHFKDDSGEMDNPEAESLMQIILFGELIYG